MTNPLYFITHTNTTLCMRVLRTILVKSNILAWWTSKNVPVTMMLQWKMSWGHFYRNRPYWMSRPKAKKLLILTCFCTLHKFETISNRIQNQINWSDINEGMTTFYKDYMCGANKNKPPISSSLAHWAPGRNNLFYLIVFVIPDLLTPMNHSMIIILVTRTVLTPQPRQPSQAASGGTPSLGNHHKLPVEEHRA